MFQLESALLALSPTAEGESLKVVKEIEFVTLTLEKALVCFDFLKFIFILFLHLKFPSPYSSSGISERGS